MTNRLICQMIVRNESERYLKQVLEKACIWADKIIILDDESTDNTREICQSFAPKVDLRRHTFGKSMFGENESQLRGYLWDLVRKEANDGDWIVSLDADEEFDSTFSKWVKGFVHSNPTQGLVSFKLADMWSPTHYRIDGFWSPLITRMFKFKNEPFGLTGTIHCGCLPAYAWNDKNHIARSDIRLKHLGWSRDEDKERKYEFYIKKATGVNLIHAQSIKQPATVKEFKDPLDLPEVLITSPIRNRAWCLPEFLQGLDLQAKTYPPEKLSFLFLINDSTDDSDRILKEWALQRKGYYKQIKFINLQFNNADAVDHTWSDIKLLNMAYMRDLCLEELKKSPSKYLFSIDSDVILQHKDTLRHLVGLDRPIVSEVFWATWEQKGANPLPNVWINGGYFLTEQFLQQLKTPGVYEVGGLGAITLIHRSVAEKGVTYQRVPNLPSDMRGEDRDFSVRATCAGFKLWASTWRTPHHVERNVDQSHPTTEPSFSSSKVDTSELKFESTKETISLCMIVKNEEKCLKETLETIKPLCHEMIVIDTGSTDKTKEIAQQFTDKVYDFQWCDDFSAARNFALSKAVGKWILVLDGDELVPPEAATEMYKLVQQPDLTAVMVPIKNICKPNAAKKNYHYSETYRLFRNTPDVKYSGCVHEDIAPSLEKMPKGQVKVTRMTNFITNLGFLLKQKDLEKKHQYYGQLLLKEIEKNPTYFKPHYEYAVFLLDQGRLDEAEVYYNKAVELEPNFYMSYNDLGVLRIKKAVEDKMMLEALSYFEIAAIKADKRAGDHHKKVIQNNLVLTKQMVNYLGIVPVPKVVPKIEPPQLVEAKS